MKRWLLLPAFACLLVFTSALGADYWPMPDNKVYHYGNAEGDSLWVSFSGGYRENRYNDGSHYCWIWEEFSDDGNGDILFLANMYYCQGWVDPDYNWWYDPDVLFLDLPLEVGKTWSTATTAHGYGSCEVVFDFEVVAEEIVNVPAGTFTTMVVVEINDWYCGNHEHTYYLDRTLGPVMILPGGYKLVGISSPIPPVPVEPSSWGRIKAMYQ